jgi:hypothetical protein
MKAASEFGMREGRQKRIFEIIGLDCVLIGRKMNEEGS